MQVIGQHKLTNASIESPLVDEMLDGEVINVLYSDPPWGSGNLKYWVTMNKKMTGAVFAPLSYDQLLSRLYELIERYVRGHVFIETGKQWAEQVRVDFLKRFFSVKTFTLKYKSGARFLECVLIAATTGSQYEFNYDPTNQVGAVVAKNCVGAVAVPGGIVLDPCCGMGYTARAAVAAGMKFRGNEFNAARLAKTEEFLRSA